MRARFAIFSATMLVALVLGAGRGNAAPAAATSTGQATILRPSTVVKRNDLDFGGWIPLGAGTVVVNPITSANTPTGSLVAAGTAGQPAKFTTTGSRNSVVIIKVPTGPVTLTRIGGGATMTASAWKLDGSSNRRIPSTQSLDFKVGATLNIAAGQLDGTYSGTFNVTVNYP